MYAATIRALAPTHDPRHIEAYMRLKYSTLDGLSKDEFEREVAIASECVRLGGKPMAERLARSYGLGA